MVRATIRDTPIFFLLVVFAISLIGCSSGIPPVDQVKAAEAKLLGKWQAKGSKFNPLSSFTVYTDKQFEFFADESVAESWLAVGSTVKSAKSPTGWQQIRAGMFKFADATHVKIDFGSEWGTTIYEVHWKDNDNVTLRAADSEIIPLHRVN
jgi:hypothetical protein